MSSHRKIIEITSPLLFATCGLKMVLQESEKNGQINETMRVGGSGPTFTEKVEETILPDKHVKYLVNERR